MGQGRHAVLGPVQVAIPGPHLGTLTHRQRPGSAEDVEARHDAAKQRPADNEDVKQLRLQSLRKLINQLKGEIARFEARAATVRNSGR